MTVNPSPPRRILAAELLPRRRSRLDRLRVRLADGRTSTLHVASYRGEAYRPRVVTLERPLPLVRWCAERGVRHAVVGGFFARPSYVPLGRVRTGGEERRSVAVEPPWDEVRGCLQVIRGAARIARADQLADATGDDLLQAGPVLVAGGRRTIVEGEDPEGFSAGARQFDSDITAGRYPRAALALTEEGLLAVACDGRTDRDAGMTLAELADALVELGAIEALNLDGGGSASLVYRSRLRNRPREEHGADLLGGRPIVTAIVFEPRRQPVRGGRRSRAAAQLHQA